MLLRNAHVTMNASQAAEYFVFEPPAIEDCTAEGPGAKALPIELTMTIPKKKKLLVIIVMVL